MSEYESEPIRGLPGELPAGEYLIWQGAPAWRPLARRAFHTHLVAGYFAVLVASSLIGVALGESTLAAALPGIARTLGVAGGALGLLAALGWLAARATVYSITNRRVVLRFGIALPKCVNLPFTQIVSAGLAIHADGTGDIPLCVTKSRLGYVHLWPYARPWRAARPEPMLRAVPEPERVARLLADALAAAVPGYRAAVEATAPAFVPAGSLAA